MLLIVFRAGDFFCAWQGPWSGSPAPPKDGTPPGAQPARQRRQIAPGSAAAVLPMPGVPRARTTLCGAFSGFAMKQHSPCGLVDGTEDFQPPGRLGRPPLGTWKAAARRYAPNRWQFYRALHRMEQAPFKKGRNSASRWSSGRLPYSTAWRYAAFATPWRGVRPAFWAGSGTSAAGPVKR